MLEYAMAASNEGQQELAAGLLTAVEQHIERWRANGFNNPQVLVVMAELYAAQDRREESIAAYTTAVDRGYLTWTKYDLGLRRMRFYLGDDPHLQEQVDRIEANIATQRELVRAMEAQGIRIQAAATLTCHRPARTFCPSRRHIT